MEQAKKFFEEVLKTEEAKELFASIEKPETEEARIEAYVELAKKLGVELTAQEILAYFNITAEAKEAGEVDDEELAQLVGGGEECSSTYMNEENCWWSDGCDVIITYYENYSCGSDAITKIKIYNSR